MWGIFDFNKIHLTVAYLQFHIQVSFLAILKLNSQTTTLTFELDLDNQNKPASQNK